MSLSGLDLVARAGARHFRRHPLQLGLAILGIGLGVALAVGIDIASASVRRAFALSSESVTGRATHQISGGPSGIDEAIYRRLRQAPDRPPGIALAPFAGGAAVPEAGGGLLQIVGVDPFVEAPFRPLGFVAPRPPTGAPAGASLAPASAAALLIEPGAAMLSEATAARLGAAVGARVPVRLGARRERLAVVAIAAPPGEAARRALDGVAIVDIATAQELTGTTGRLGAHRRDPAGGGRSASGRAALDRAAAAGGRAHRAGRRARRHAGAAHARVRSEPDRAQPARPARRRLPHLQHHELLRGPAPAPAGHPAHARRDARPARPQSARSRRWRWGSSAARSGCWWACCCRAAWCG